MCVLRDAVDSRTLVWLVCQPAHPRARPRAAAAARSAAVAFWHCASLVSNREALRETHPGCRNRCASVIGPRPARRHVVLRVGSPGRAARVPAAGSDAVHTGAGALECVHAAAITASRGARAPAGAAVVRVVRFLTLAPAHAHHSLSHTPTCSQVGLVLDAGRFFFFLLTLTMVNICMAALFRSFSWAFPDMETAQVAPGPVISIQVGPSNCARACHCHHASPCCRADAVLGLPHHALQDGMAALRALRIDLRLGHSVRQRRQATGRS